MTGAAIGATLLLTLPASAFDAIVPALIAIALILVIVQPRLTAWLAQRGHTSAEHGPALQAAVGATGVYGGYFGAAQGIILISILGIGIRDELQRLNALKNVLASTANLVAGLIFVFAADVDWAVAGPDRRRLDRRRRPRRALRPTARPRRAAGADRRHRRRRDRPPDRRLSEVAGATPA